MPSRTKLVAAAALLLLVSCTTDVIIDVNALPCGTARGTAASGSFSFSGTVVDDGCKDFLGTPLLAGGATVTVTHAEPGSAGCGHGRLEVAFPASSGVPAFTLKGGIWSDGSFRIGQAISDGSRNTYRVLMDGKFTALTDTSLPQDHFSGSARVDFDEAGSETVDPECSFKVNFSSTRTTR